MNHKCTNKGCNDSIPKGEEAYFRGKIVCRYCYSKLRTGRGEKRSTLIIAYKRWLTRK